MRGNFSCIELARIKSGTARNARSIQGEVQRVPGASWQGHESDCHRRRSRSGTLRFRARLYGKLGVLESVERWKIIRELRNAVNHEYEEDADRLTQFFMGMIDATPELFACHQKLLDFCREAYGIKPE